MYSQGLGTEEDHEKAAYWLTMSAEERYKFAEYSLGGLYYRGQGVEKSYESAFDLYLKSAKQGFLYADFEVAKMYRDGIGTDKNEKESNKYFRSAFIGFEKLEKQSHDDKIQYRLGWMLQNGIGTEKDIKRGKEYYEKSAKLGNTFACYSLAKLILAEENPTGEEIKRAIEYLKEASENGNQFAQYSLGKIYLNGDFVEKDIYKAIGLFELSSEQDNEYAQFFLDNMDRFYNPSVSLTVSRMFHHMSKIFEDNVPLKSSGVGIKIDSKLMRKLREKKVAQGHKKDDYKQNIEL
jgi:TPR repeat protein